MEAIKNKRIAVLYGGSSSEREISLLSGRAVYESLRSAGFCVQLIDAKDPGFMGELKKSGVDFVFIALHGKYGEDGELQLQLEKEGLMYSGSSPLACQRAMDKEESRRFFLQADLQVPHGVVISDIKDTLTREVRYPLFTKPLSGGSSIGITLVKTQEALRQALEVAFAEHPKVLVEERIEGRELTVGVLGRQTLPLIEIITKREFFDYAAKYEDDQTRYEEPRDISHSLKEKIYRCAFRAHDALGCAGFSRVDLMLSGEDLTILEVNAIPGLTKKSLLPKMAQKKGISFTDLCVRIMTESLAQRNRPIPKARVNILKESAG